MDRLYLKDDDERPKTDSPAIVCERGSVEPGHGEKRDAGSHVTSGLTSAEQNDDGSQGA